jgi:predicted peptidase
MFRKSECHSYEYLIYRPGGADDPGRAWPLLVFLHGAGECGDDLGFVKRHGPPRRIEDGARLPFVVVAPQSRRGAWNPAALDVMLDGVLAAHRVDPDRVYLTGLSLGGFGTFAWAIARPERFAAIAPVCGGGNPAQAHRLRHLPVWAFHGARDRVVPPELSDQMVAELERIGADVRYTRYPDADHDSWTVTYANPELYAWLLRHRRRRGAALSGGDSGVLSARGPA